MSDENEVQAKWLPVRDAGFAIHGDKALLFKALATAQAQFREVKKTRENPFFKSQYADLADVLDACVPALNANGLALIQPPCRPSSDKDWTLMTLLTHESGAYMEITATIPPVADWQKFGSAVTYCRRYTAGALLGVAPEPDDDGNAATHDKAHQARQEAPRRGPPPLPAQAAKATPAKEEPKANGRTVVEMPKGVPPVRLPDLKDPVPSLEPTTQVDEPAQDQPATPATKLAIRVAMLALGYKGPDVMRKLASLFGPGVKPDMVDTESKSVKLLDALHADIDLVPGLVLRLPEIEAEQARLVSK